MNGGRGASPGPAYLIKGDDPSLVAVEARSLIEELLGDRDPSLVVEEHGSATGERLEVGAVIDAFTTPPFLVDRRIVVLRDAGELDAEAAGRLIATLDPPPPGAVLVLVGGGGTIPKALEKAVAAAGEVIDVSTRASSKRKSYLDEHLRHASVRFSAGSQRLVAEHLGEDLGRLSGLLETLAAAYGQGVTVDEAMLQPFLGARGSVPVFELTGAIERGEMSKALSIVDRMMGPGGTSGHVLLASLDNHFSRLARLDGAAVRNEEEAAALLGIAPYPAKRLLGLSRTLSSDAMGDAIGLIAQADLDLKGETGLPEQMVIEILVARLARLVRSHIR